MFLENYGPGRPPNPLTMKTLEALVEAIKKNPGMPSGRIAKMLGISSFRCSQLARRLEKRGMVQVQLVNRSLTYTLIEEPE